MLWVGAMLSINIYICMYVCMYAYIYYVVAVCTISKHRIGTSQVIYFEFKDSRLHLNLVKISNLLVDVSVWINEVLSIHLYY